MNNTTLQWLRAQRQQLQAVFSCYLQEHLQVYHTPAQRLSKIEDCVFNCVFLSIQVQDLFVEWRRGHDDVIDVIVLRLVLHLLQGLAQLLILFLQQLNITVNLSLLRKTVKEKKESLIKKKRIM